MSLFDCSSDFLIVKNDIATYFRLISLGTQLWEVKVKLIHVRSRPLISTMALSQDVSIFAHIYTRSLPRTIPLLSKPLQLQSLLYQSRTQCSGTQPEQDLTLSCLETQLRVTYKNIYLL
jgi:hypothetical protein